MRYKSISEINLASFTSQFINESDRAAAVLGAALLDERLKEVFYSRLSENQDILLKGSGPLCTFSSRINLAFALQWVDSDTAHDLEVIRKIRNNFAHNIDNDLSFQTPSIADSCKNLFCSSAYINGFTEAAHQSLNFSTALIEDLITKKFYSTNALSISY